MKTVARWLALVAAITVGGRAALLWRDINEVNATLRIFRNMTLGPRR